MKDTLKAILIAITVIGAPIGLAIIGATIEKHDALKTWNNGVHKNCGGKWDLFSATHVRNQGTFYYYKCKKCNAVFETQCHVK